MVVLVAMVMTGEGMGWVAPQSQETQSTCLLGKGTTTHKFFKGEENLESLSRLSL